MTQPLDPLDQDWVQLASRDDWGVPAVYEAAARDLVSRELFRLAEEMEARGPRWLDAEDVRARAEQLASSTWCNCQAIPGTVNYPGPWHERGGEAHYPCAQGRRGSA
jgi:hypothetical protein